MHAPSNRIRAAVLDGDPPGRTLLVEQLSLQHGIEVVGAYAEQRALLSEISSVRPDVTFLNVEAPEFSALELAMHLREALPAWPVFVFVARSEDYAVDAFEAGALDYLLKPIDPDRIARTLRRVQRRLRLPARVLVPLKRLLVMKGNRSRIINIEDVDWIEAAGNYIRLHTEAESYLLRRKLAELEQRLDPSRFVRVHRCTVVNLDRIQSIDMTSSRQQLVVLGNGKRLRMSASCRQRLAAAVPGLS